ncbi:MAG: FAD/NAD(P)-binding protein [Xanthobacteraceae bacterium]
MPEAERPNTDSGADVIIVGGGASGVLMAFHLLRDPTAEVRVILIEKRPQLGRGVAYGTTNPDHLLNVRAASMSAVRDEPDHFWSWVCANPTTTSWKWKPENDPSCFAPRMIYGDYLSSLTAPFTAHGSRPGRLRIIHGECLSIDEGRSGVTVTLADGSHHSADFGILATGHDARSKAGGCYVDAWTAPSDAGVDRSAKVLIVGTGLTMVDYVLSLDARGHTGPIVAMSRRGLLPREDRQQQALSIPAPDVPLGAGISELCRWLRNLVATRTAQGADWRSVVDGLRPFNQQIWQQLPEAARRSFLRHGRAWWNVHRHRMPQEIAARIGAATASGRLTVMAARLRAVEQGCPGATIHYQRRGGSAIKTMQIDNIVECRGVVTNPMQTSNPVIRNLLDQERARIDPLGIGLDVAPDGAIVARTGAPSERLFAVGPIARAALWEITAVPEIRGQCAELAGRIQRTRLRCAG